MNYVKGEFLSIILSGEKGRGQPPCYKSEGIESVSSLRTLQNEMNCSLFTHSSDNYFQKQNFLKFHLPVAGSLKYFKKSWEILTKDLNILAIIEEYRIPLVEEPVQKKVPHTIKMNREKPELVNDGEISHSHRELCQRGISQHYS